MKHSVLLIMALLGSQGFAQQPSRPQNQKEGSFVLPAFTEGLQTRYSANAIPDGGLTQALNVVLDEDIPGVVVNRNGYAKYNTTALPNSQTVRGLWPFDAADGTKYIIAFSSSSFYSSKGDGTWTAINGASGFSTTKDFDCTQTIGYFWCANGDTVWNWDGTSTSTVSGAPLGTLINNFRNRVFLSGVPGSVSRVFGSGELVGTDWSVVIPGVSTSPTNINVGGINNGQAVTCLMGAFQDVFLIGTRDALYGLYGFSRTDFQLRELSREVGCLEPRSVREKNNCLYWLSRRGLEKFCGASIERISDPIRDQIDTIIATAGNPRNATDSSQSDFQAGNLNASGANSPVSATILAGTLVPSSFSHTDSATSDFTAGTLLRVSTSGSNQMIALSTITNQNTPLNGGFETGTSSRWTLTNVPAALTCGGSSASTVVVANSVPIPGSGFSNYGFLSNQTNRLSGGTCYNATSLTDTYSILDGNSVLIKGPTALSQCPTTVDLSGLTTTYATIRVTRYVYFSGLGTGFTNDETLSPGFYVPNAIATIYCSSNGAVSPPTSSTLSWDIGITSAIYNSSGVFTSQVFDTGFSTTIGGPLTISSSVPNATTLLFQVRTASSASGAFSAWTPITNGNAITLTKEFYQYMSSFTTTNSTTTPSIKSVSLSAETTAYFISQCRNPGSAITAWGQFSCTNQLTTGGTLSFAVSTGPSCNSVTRTTVTWNSQTNNTAISVSTSQYVAYRVLFSVDAATQVPILNDCTINWQEGATRPPVAASVYRDRYHLAYTSSTASGVGNDHELVLDRFDKWTLFDDHNCYSLALYNRKLYCGASTASGQVWQQDIGTDDDGAAFTSRIRTKAFNFGLPESKKTFDDLYLDISPSPDLTYTENLTARYLLDRGTDTYALSTVNLNEDPSHLTLAKFPFPLTGPTSGRYIQLELESSGLNQPWRLFGGRQYFSIIRKE